MKKYKLTFSFFNLFTDSSKEVITLQVFTKAFTISIGGLIYLTEDQYTAYAAITGFAIDSLLHFVAIDKIDKTDVSTKSKI